MVDEQVDDQDLLADESKTSGKVGKQGNSYRNRNIVIPTVLYNKNQLAPTKCHQC